MLLAAAAGCTGEPDDGCGDLCVEAVPVVVGAALPLSGPLAPYGLAQRRGAERAVEQVTGEGGLQVGDERRPVELLVRDTASRPDAAGQAALVLVRGPFRVSALVGPCAPPLALVRVAEAREVPLVTGCSPLPAPPFPRRLTAEVAPSEQERATAVLRAVARSAGGRTVALFLSNDWSDAPYLAAADAAGVAVTGTYRPSSGDWSAAVDAAARDGAGLAVAVTQPPEGLALSRALRTAPAAPALAYASEAGTGSAWSGELSGRDGLLTDAVAPLPEEGLTPPEVDDAVAGVSFELTALLLDAVTRAGSSDRRAVAAALDGGRAVVGGTDAVLQERRALLPFRLAEWRDGALVPAG